MKAEIAGVVVALTLFIGAIVGAVYLVSQFDFRQAAKGAGTVYETIRKDFNEGREQTDDR
jgi:hypothetical protein